MKYNYEVALLNAGNGEVDSYRAAIFDELLSSCAKLYIVNFLNSEVRGSYAFGELIS